MTLVTVSNQLSRVLLKLWSTARFSTRYSLDVLTFTMAVSADLCLGPGKVIILFRTYSDRPYGDKNSGSFASPLAHHLQNNYQRTSRLKTFCDCFLNDGSIELRSKTRQHSRRGGVWWGEGGPKINKSEQVSSDYNQISLASGTLPCDLSHDVFHITYPTSPPWTDRHLWKHYLRQTSFAGGNKAFAAYL